MIQAFFDNLAWIDSLFWSYIGFLLIVILGSFLTIQGRFFQFRAFPLILKTFLHFLSNSSSNARGVHPIKTFFASVGGMIGLGNVVSIVTAIQLGGPGALFWVWVVALVGTIIKYSEIYLGLKHRVKNDRGGYDGGPMYFLQIAFKNRVIPIFISSLLCIYGVDVYLFTVVTNTLSSNFDLNHYVVMIILLILIMYSSFGGISRIGKICTCIIPFFMVFYIAISLWVIFQERTLLPAILKNVFISAFSGHAALGGFAGSTALLAIQHGISRAAYSADIGIGYDSIIQSESNTTYPERQARLAVLGVCVDNLICTLSILVVLVTGIWTSKEHIEGAQLMQKAFSQYIPFMHLFMPIFLFVLGYSTMIAYFCVGLKCSRFISPKYGTKLYLIYGVSALLFFSFFDQTHALRLMSLAGIVILITNLLGIFMLRHQIAFVSDPASLDNENKQYVLGKIHFPTQGLERNP